MFTSWFTTQGGVGGWVDGGSFWTLINKLSMTSLFFMIFDSGGHN
jgi:hypothetical protein